ncbi:Ubiquitin-associated domain/translation elongation factor EF-Ts [Macleaya cordata]|uniref:Ubiquitin-associated domain/translation elongation factor EF-Ts n=1 Tax=Macleaya cordata TaxID=56857 RepID=A0A200PRN6_MACCD|nr:Ubiquitin-associated domain/translation elongation factor EF-Ts [Macleaya cordata]
MRSNIVTEAGLPTRVSQWWEGVPFLTSAIVIVCGIIYLVCLFVGYDSFVEICFLPSEVMSHFQVYRIYTSILFHGSLLHVLFNMLALVPLGSELERIMGSIRLLLVIILLATSNAVFHLCIAILISYNPFHTYPYLMNECAIGFSGIVFSMIVIETSLSGVQSRRLVLCNFFDLCIFRYAWILLVVFQLLMTNVSLLGHLCGILSGFAYTYGLFNYLLPGSSFYSSIEGSSFLSSCVRRPKFILCTGGNPSNYIPTHSSPNATSSGLISGNIWRNLSSWMPQRETTSPQSAQDGRFPGRGRTLSSTVNQSASAINSDSSLQARLLDNSSPDHLSVTTGPGTGQLISNARHSSVDGAAAVARAPAPHQNSGAFDEEIQKLVAMGFERTQAEVALTAADGDSTVAVEILMTQQAS